jgi:hypothetical protein
MSPVSWKRGSTFAVSVVYTPSAGDPANLSGVTVATSVMDNNFNRYPLTVVITSGTTFTAVYIGDSSDWAAGTAAIDYKCSIAGIVFYSSTSRFTIEPQVTL